MADQSRVTEYPVLLECGHNSKHFIDGALRMLCRACEGRETAIMAFETREWHVKCSACRFGKWTGKDEAAAHRARANHARTKQHYGIMVDFLIPDDVKKLWRVHYGRNRVPARFMPRAVSRENREETGSELD